MPVLTEPIIDLDPDRIALELNHGRANRAVAQALAQALEAARPLFRPRALYDWCRVTGREGNRVTLAASESGREATLDIGPLAGLMDQAQLALVSVSTLGPDLEERVQQMHQERQMLPAYYLDSVGVSALGEVGQAVRRLAEEDAARRGWGVGYALAPGSLKGWTVAGQRELTSLLDLEAIGASLNTGGLLVPLKSASGLIGLGPGYESAKVASVCRWCSIRETCWRRKQDQPVPRRASA